MKHLTTKCPAEKGTLRGFKVRFLRRALLASFFACCVVMGPYLAIASGAAIDSQPAPQGPPPTASLDQDEVAFVMLSALVGGIVLLVVWQVWLYLSPSSWERKATAPPDSSLPITKVDSPPYTMHSHPSRSENGSPPTIAAVSPEIPKAAASDSEATPVHGYFILRDDESEGPYSVEELQSLWGSGEITCETFYCEEGYEQWLPLENIADKLSPTPPPPPPPPAPAKPRNSEIIPASGDLRSEKGQGESPPPPLGSSHQPSISARKTFMQRKKLVLVIGAVVFLACGIFPPWSFVPGAEGTYGQKNAGYGMLFSPPLPRGHPELEGLDSMYYSKIDMSRLGIEWACVCALAAVAWVLAPKPE